MAGNYVFSRRPDSANYAFEQAMLHPDRLTDARRHRLQADVAYNLEYHLPAAVQWYDLFLEEEPTSVAGFNNRALYLSSMGRHEEAVVDFERAATLDPFGRGPRQIQLLNLAAELVVLGRIDTARVVAQQLTGPFDKYAQILFSNATGTWADAARLARAYTDDPSLQTFVRIPATTTLAGTYAVRGAVSAAYDVLRNAAASAGGASARWYWRAYLFLTEVSGDRPSSPPLAVQRDTTPGGMVLRGMWAALLGDTSQALEHLTAILALDDVEQLRLGSGALFLDALIAGQSGDWATAAELLGEPARRGEHDALNLDRVDSYWMHWVAARAYERLGELDSAITLLESALDATRVPPNHLSLRGIPHAFIHHTLARWYSQNGQTDAAQPHWHRFLDEFTEADEPLRHLTEEAVEALIPRTTVNQSARP
jgi:tetratricopeptide (TPR) repeat protein